MTLTNKIFKWLNVLSFIGCIGLFCVTLDVELLFIALGNISVVWLLKDSNPVRQDIVAHCGIIMGILGYLVFSASWVAFVFLILVYASALVFLKISAEDIDKMHQEAS
jgi:hypothetical protein